MCWLLLLPKSIEFSNATEIEPARNGYGPKLNGILAKNSKFQTLNTLKMYKIWREKRAPDFMLVECLFSRFIWNVCSRSSMSMALLTQNFYSRHQQTNELFFLPINFDLKSSEKLSLFSLKLHNVQNKQNFPRNDDL